jgi:septal ring factor EnvC (AmiA/AmiB activator)
MFTLLFSQKKEQLQQQNAELKKQIAIINANLTEAHQKSRLSISYLNEVNKKIQLREKIYGNTQKEKKLIEDDIYLRQLEINRQKKELAVLRKNYAEVLVKAYKNKGVQNKITFILSSKNLGQALRRIQYLKNYADYQEKKAIEISDAAKKLQQSIDLKQKSVKEKETLLNSQKKELLTIEAERKQKAIILEDFKKNEAQLTAELRKKQAESKKLESQIKNIIAEELKIAKAKEEQRKKEEAEKIRQAKIIADREKAKIETENKAKLEQLALEKKKADEEAKKLKAIADKKAEEENRVKTDAALKESSLAAKNAKAAEEKAAEAKAAEEKLKSKTEEDKKAAENKIMINYGVSTTPIGSSFVSNKGRMTMPAYGTITHRFGRQQHPVFKNIVEENNGIKISVPRGTVAKCVAPGTVSRIVASGDGTKMVFVKHDDYFTIYANLESTLVSANQQVSAGTAVGVIGEDFDGTYTLDFQIWNGTTPVDPLSWIN